MATVSPTAASPVSVVAARPREKGTSLTRDALRRLRRNKLAMAGLTVVIFLGLLAIFADVIAPYPYTKTNFGRLTEAPSRDYPLGTDQIGRDLLSRMIYGGRVSLLIGVTAVLISSTIGVLLGLSAGYFGGRLDWTIMTLINVMLTFPFVLLALAVIAVLGPSLINMIIVLGVADWPLYARVIRAETMAIREREFVLAGRAVGMSHFRIAFGQILPNLVSIIVVIATLQVARVIILESFLSFLGLGVQPPTPAWGNMLGEGRVYMLNSWWIATFPGLAIFVTTLAINVMGNALRDWLDPHMKV